MTAESVRLGPPSPNGTFEAELIEIARAITRERDIDQLLALILERSRYITGADAGSIYVVEGDAPDVSERMLHFKLSQNDSCAFESREFTMPVSTRSIAGYAATTRKPINIPDVYRIAPHAPFGFDASFDEKVGYRTRSMIAVPMISARDEVIGVIQLINRKQHPEQKLTTARDFASEVVAFDQRSEDLLATLAAQAGIALENALLYEEIKGIFEGFVRASVQAIEQRDPTTSGHSLRVSVLARELAEVVDRVDVGPYARTAFSRRELKELEYASLLHDFGKIGVREQVLVKAKKLYPQELQAIRDRFAYAMKATEVTLLRQQLDAVRRGISEEEVLAIAEELDQKRANLERAIQMICDANEPTVLSEGDFTRITELSKETFVDAAGVTRPLLTPEEAQSLCVTRGSLNDRELREIRSHVVHTFNFLSRIPWGKTFARIPVIAGAHHERLDGTGYPRGLKGDEISVQSRIMTIADIYDALTARDRPYKRAVPSEKALDIIEREVTSGYVDGELVRLFRDAEVFRRAEGDLHY